MRVFEDDGLGEDGLRIDALQPAGTMGHSVLRGGVQRGEAKCNALARVRLVPTARPVASSEPRRAAVIIRFEPGCLPLCEPGFIGWMDYYTWPELCLSNPAVVLIATCFWRLLRVVFSIAARTKGQLSSPQSSGRVRFWLLDIGRLFLQCVSVCMATAVPLLLAWAGTYRHYFHTGTYPATPILISWIAGGVTWWLLDRRIASRPPGKGVSLFPCPSPQCC